MKIFILDGIVVCSLDNKNGAFLSETSGCFDDFYKHNLKLRSDSFIAEYRSLQTILTAADKHGIEISEEVEETYCLLDERQRNIERGLEEQRRIEAEAKEKRQKWVRLQKNGCKGCMNCRATGFDDDYKCLASGDELPIKDCPGFDGINHYLFNLKPFPTQKCPYKYESQQA